jgi:hypothetical protein
MYENTGKQFHDLNSLPIMRKKYMTIGHAKNQISMLSFAELLFLKTVMEMQVLNCSINYQIQ